MYYYFAQFAPDAEQPGMYNVHFPDFPGCITFGEGLDDAMCMAMDALTGYIETSIEDGETLPEPSDFEAARAKSLAYNQKLDIPPQPGTLYMLVPADPKPEPYVRLNISMKPRLLSQIDRVAKEQGMTRSGLLAAAAREYIRRPDAV